MCSRLWWDFNGFEVKNNEIIIEKEMSDNNQGNMGNSSKSMFFFTKKLGLYGFVFYQITQNQDMETTNYYWKLCFLSMMNSCDFQYLYGEFMRIPVFSLG